MFSRLILIGFLIVALAKNSFAVQCNTNPCQLAGDFLPPNYQCFQSTENVNNVICTCPDGQTQVNGPCRICNTVNCGPTGVCIERSFYEALYYACGCTNGTNNYLNPGPCPDAVISTTVPPVVFCNNGGTYNPATGLCLCPAGYTGSRCETLLTSGNCQNVLCANGGVCNPTPTYENGVEMQCLCVNGFSGPNCEIVGTPGRCVAGLCQNGGICEEKTFALGIYAFCRCPSGYTGQCCQSRYFSCPASGVFADPVNCKFGRYFQCNGSTLLTLSCPRGLRYNFMKMRCDSDVSCPP